MRMTVWLLLFVFYLAASPRTRGPPSLAMSALNQTFARGADWDAGTPLHVPTLALSLSDTYTHTVSRPQTAVSVLSSSSVGTEAAREMLLDDLDAAAGVVDGE